MRAPTGVGIWIAFPSMLGLNPLGIATMLKLANFDWVAPRGGEGSHIDTNWTAAHTRACADLGIPTYRWIFSRPGSWHAEVQSARRFQDEGDAGYIIDAESAWERPGLFDVASLYCEELDAKLGSNYFIADAPWPYVSYHWALDVHGKPVSGFPFHAFAPRMNARMPQAYWTEISNQGARHHLPRIDMEWQKFNARFPELARPVWPIGITYGKAEMKRWGSQQLPPGEITAEDLEFFDDRYRLGPRSYYSREAAGDLAVKTLATICAPTFDHGGTFDNTNQPATPFGRETQAEWDADETARNEAMVARHDGVSLPVPRVTEPVLVAFADRLQQLPPDKRHEALAFMTRKVGAHPT